MRGQIGDARLQPPIVGQQQQSLAVQIQPPGGIHPRLVDVISQCRARLALPFAPWAAERFDGYRRALREAGLELQQTRGMGYNPITRRYWLSHDTSVNYLFAMRKA